MSSPTEELARLLSEIPDVQVCFGLRAQGHLPTIRRMLKEGASWEEIGAAIGWQGKAAAEWFDREDLADRMLESAASRIEAQGCRCRELKDARWGFQDGNPCAWCCRPKEEHGPEEPGLYGMKGGRLCPVPGVSSQYYAPNGEPVVLAHSPACPRALANALRRQAE
jgi:hypothetical protein